MQGNIVPKHIGIIMDGNRRFSKKLMLKPWNGHEWGAKKVEKLFNISPNAFFPKPKITSSFT